MNKLLSGMREKNLADGKCRQDTFVVTARDGPTQSATHYATGDSSWLVNRVILPAGGACILALAGVLWWVISNNTQAISHLLREMSEFRVEVAREMGALQVELSVTNTKVDRMDAVIELRHQSPRR